MLSFLLSTLLLAAMPAAMPSAPPFVTSVLSIDTTTHTATFPLHRGLAHGKTVWYILTDSSDPGVAKSRGLVYAPDMASLGDEAIATASQSAGVVTFPGAPDFSPARSYDAGANGFPPASASPGAVADGAYTPFVRVAGEKGVLNAPIVATGDGPFDVTHHSNTHDRVVAIDTTKNTVTLVLARGFIGGKPVYYLSTEASDPVAAAVERATYVPRLAKAGPAGLKYLAEHTPLAVDATAAGAATVGSPFNVLSLVPDLAHPYAANGYSPLWSAEVVAAPQSMQLTSYAQIAPLAKPAGFAVNCPAIAFGGGGY
jgi:hypothetical protein